MNSLLQQHKINTTTVAFYTRDHKGKSRRDAVTQVFAITVFLLGSFVLLYGINFSLLNSQKASSVKGAATKIQTSPTPSLAVAPSPIRAFSRNSFAPAVTNTLAPSSQGPTPTPSYYPLTMNIDYPSENQVIEGDPDHARICVVDSSGGTPRNFEFVFKKNKINNNSWTEYEHMYTLCFAPEEGDTTLQLQYKDTAHNEETPIYTRHFVFHHISPTPEPPSTPTPTPWPNLHN